MATPVQIRESLVPFKARILAAVPGTSLNRRIYTKDVLKQCAPFYDGKPFMMDHSLNSEAVIGIFSRPRYSTERGMDGKMYEGLWLDAVGRMDQDMFEKCKGKGLVPPLVRGFSIGGTGDGDWQGSGDILLKQFVPEEGSMTPFPGIPQAHIAALDIIREHYLQGREIRRQVLDKAKQDPEVYRILKSAGLYKKEPVHEYEVKKKTSNQIPVKENEVSLEEAERQAEKAQRIYVKEAPLPGPDKGTGRDNIPDPIVRKPVLHVQPQGTTSADTGLKMDPMQHSTTTTPFLAKGATVSGSGGRRNGNPTEKAPGTASDAGAPGSDDADELPIKTPKAGRTTTQTPGPGKLSPSGTGMTDQGEEEEEEEEERRQKVRQDSSDDSTDDDSTDDDMEDEEEERRKEALRNLGDQTHPKPRNPQKIKTPVAGRTTTKTPGYGKLSPSGSGLTDQAGEEEEEEEESKPTTSVEASRKMQIRQDDEPVGVSPGMKSGTDSSDDRPEEEEEDGVTVNPILKTAQRAVVNPVKDSQMNPDVIPIQARAFSLPVDTAVYQAAMRFDRMRNPDRQKEAQGYIDAWAKAKEPKKEKLKRVLVKATESKAGVVTTGTRSLISTIQPTIAAREDENTVETRGQTNMEPTRPLMQAQSTVNTLSESAADLMSKMSKEPFGYWNQAGRAYRKLLPQILDVR